MTCNLCSANTSSWYRCAGPNDTPSMTPLQPTECDDNYFNVPIPNTNGSGTTNKCIATSTNFQYCLTLDPTNPANCATCIPPSNSYVLSGGTCKTCPQFCSACSNSNNAVVCNTCMDGYYLSGTSCTKCGTGCAQCDNATSCVSCLAGYYSSTNNSCVSCKANNCISCTAPATGSTTPTCTKCASGFFLNTNSKAGNNNIPCYQCP